MFARSLLAAGLLLGMTLSLRRRILQQPRVGPMTPLQQQQQRMMRGNMMGPGMNGMPFDATGTIETIGAAGAFK